MEQKVDRLELLMFTGIFAVVLLAGMFFIPWRQVTWGRFKVAPGDTITVMGEAKTQQRNQKATFSAGVNAISDNKDTAVADVNKKIQAIIDGAKAFGISSEDIKTQNLNIYQGEETYYEDNRQKVRPGQWRISNTVEITLSNVERTQALTDMLTQSGATNIYGPNFTLDDTTDAERALIEEAMNNAREKALQVAGVSGRKLGKMSSFTEGYQASAPVYRMEGGGGGGAEPGTGTVTKTVTVTYEISP